MMWSILDHKGGSFPCECEGSTGLSDLWYLVIYWLTLICAVQYSITVYLCTNRQPVYKFLPTRNPIQLSVRLSIVMFPQRLSNNSCDLLWLWVISNVCSVFHSTEWSHAVLFHDIKVRIDNEFHCCAPSTYVIFVTKPLGM